MANYRRAFVENSYLFLTVVTFNRCPILISHIDLLKESFHQSQQFFDYQIIGLVILPEHFHIIIKPKINHEYPRIMMSIKYHFSKNFKPSEILIDSYIKKREKGVWQRRYWEHTIRNQDDLNRHLDYIHYNPVKHKLVSAVEDWKYSTFFEYLKRGYYEPHWGCTDDVTHISELNFE